MSNLWNSVADPKRDPFRGRLNRLTPKMVEKIRRDFEDRQRRVEECVGTFRHLALPEGHINYSFGRGLVECNHCGDLYKNPTLPVFPRKIYDLVY